MRIFPIKGKFTPLKLPNGDQVLAQSDGNRFYLDITTVTGTTETKQFVSSKDLLNYLKEKGFNADPDLERLQKIPKTLPDSAISDLNEKEREVLKAAKKLTEIWARVPENLPEKEYDELFEEEIQPAERELAQALSEAYSGEDPENTDWATEEAQESGRTYLQWERLVLSHYFDPNKKVLWYFWDAASGDASAYPSLKDIFDDDEAWEDYARVWDDSTTAHIGILNEVTIWDITDKQAHEGKFYGWIASRDEYVELSDDLSEEDVKAQGITKVYEGLEAISLTSPESRLLKNCVVLGLALEQSQFGHPHVMKAITTEYAQAIDLLERKIRDASEVRDLALGLALFRALEKESIRRLSSDQVKEIQATLAKYS